MRNRLSQGLAAVPTPLAGLALGIASLGYSWHFVVPDKALIPAVAAIVAAALLLLLIGKFALYPKRLLQELRHPVVGSVTPTFAMTLMVITLSLQTVLPRLSMTLWLLAIAIHLSFLVIFIYHRCQAFSLTDMVPSWFVPPVGIIVAAICYPTAAFQPLAYAIFWFGLVCYAALLPWMLYRLLGCSELPDNAKPTLAILAAPASVCLAGYLTVTDTPAPGFVALLTALSLLKTATIYHLGRRLLRLPFSPGYAAFTFPLVIGATAMFKLQAQCIAWGLDSTVIQLCGILASTQLTIATFVVGYVIVRYMYFYTITSRRLLVQAA
ncbi:MAG: TDT family transporter [Nitrincola lacisaponensis]|uniref:TDT family transporter n=1 Tax=Nitrincola lacisaponensis TaxID=267850 RepID=UPI00391A0224